MRNTYETIALSRARVATISTATRSLDVDDAVEDVRENVEDAIDDARDEVERRRRR